MTTLYSGESENCCAMCRLHHCGLTAKQMRGRECLNKQCVHLVKIEDYPYWRQRERTRLARAKRKEAVQKMIEAATNP